MSDNFLVSIIVPSYNEAQNMQPLLRSLMQELKTHQYEIIVVDDGSQDQTAQEVKQLAKKNKQIKLISFVRNFGHQMALSCGYQLSSGDCVVSMDADLQDPPKVISQMIIKWKKGAKVVYAKRTIRNVDTFFKRTSAAFFYKFINLLSDVPIPSDVGDFRLLDRDVVNYLNTLPEHSRFLRGLVAWSGQPAAFVEYKREKRHAGETHYTFSKMMNFALEGITSFSTKPLRVATYLGFLFASISFLGIIYAILGKIFLPEYWVPGWTALFVGIMAFGGVQLITIGIIGEYIGRIYNEVQKRPQFLIKERFNI